MYDGVELGEGLIRACAHCSHTSRGHRTDREAAGLVFEALPALPDLVLQLVVRDHLAMAAAPAQRDVEPEA
jgi:hypothetical protein